jgi:hypothetical protein
MGHKFSPEIVIPDSNKFLAISLCSDNIRENGIKEWEFKTKYKGPLGEAGKLSLK